MEYTKPPLDNTQIVEMLKQRQLIIDDDEQALEQLKNISYFRLANYLRPMEQDKDSHIFKPNSHFDNAVGLYYFDKKIKSSYFYSCSKF